MAAFSSCFHVFRSLFPTSVPSFLHCLPLLCGSCVCHLWLKCGGKEGLTQKSSFNAELKQKKHTKAQNPSSAGSRCHQGNGELTYYITTTDDG